MVRKINLPFVCSLLGLILTAGVLSACQPKSTPITGADRDAVLAYAQPQADTLIKGLVEHDYAIFSTDFDATLADALTQKSFNEMVTSFDEKIGSYQSAEVTSVEQSGEYVAVTYNLIFERSDQVTMRIVFSGSEDHSVSGLWFNSPDLQ